MKLLLPTANGSVISAGHWAAQEFFRVMRTEAVLSVKYAAPAAAASQVQGKANVI